MDNIVHSHGFLFSLIDQFLTDLSTFYDVYNKSINELLDYANSIQYKEWRELYEITNCIRDIKTLSYNLTKKYNKYLMKYKSQLSKLDKNINIDYLVVFKRHEYIKKLRKDLENGILDIDFKTKLRSYTDVIKKLKNNIDKENKRINLQPINVNKIIIRTPQTSVIPPEKFTELVDGVNYIKANLITYSEQINKNKTEIKQREVHATIPIEENQLEYDDDYFDEVDPDYINTNVDQMDVDYGYIRTLTSIGDLEERYTRLAEELARTEDDVKLLKRKEATPQFDMDAILESMRNVEASVDAKLVQINTSWNNRRKTVFDDIEEEFENEVKHSLEDVKRQLRVIDGNYKKIETKIDEIANNKETLYVSKLEDVKNTIFGEIQRQYTKLTGDVETAIKNLDTPTTDFMLDVQKNILKDLAKYVQSVMLTEVNVTNITRNTFESLYDEFENREKDMATGLISRFNDYRERVEQILTDKNNEIINTLDVGAKTIEKETSKLKEHNETMGIHLDDYKTFLEGNKNNNKQIIESMNAFKSIYKEEIENYRSALEFVTNLTTKTKQDIDEHVKTLHYYKEIFEKQKNLSNLLENAMFDDDTNLRDYMWGIKNYIENENFEKIENKRREMDNLETIYKKLNESKMNLEEMVTLNKDNAQSYKSNLDRYETELNKYRTSIENELELIKKNSEILNKSIDTQKSTAGITANNLGKLEKAATNVKQSIEHQTTIQQKQEELAKKMNETAANNLTLNTALKRERDRYVKASATVEARAADLKIKETINSMVEKIDAFEAKLVKLQQKENQNQNIEQEIKELKKSLIENDNKIKELQSLATSQTNKDNSVNKKLLSNYRQLQKLNSQYNDIVKSVSKVKVSIKELKALKSLLVDVQEEPVSVGGTIGKKRRLK